MNTSVSMIGLTLVPGKPQEVQATEGGIRLTNATLGRQVLHVPFPPISSRLFLKFGTNEVGISSLIPGKCETTVLDIYIPSGAIVTLEAQGHNEIYACGNVLPSTDLVHRSAGGDEASASSELKRRREHPTTSTQHPKRTKFDKDDRREDVELLTDGKHHRVDASMDMQKLTTTAEKGLVPSEKRSVFDQKPPKKLSGGKLLANTESTTTGNAEDKSKSFGQKLGFSSSATKSQFSGNPQNQSNATQKIEYNGNIYEVLNSKDGTGDIQVKEGDYVQIKWVVYSEPGPDRKLLAKFDKNSTNFEVSDRFLPPTVVRGLIGIRAGGQRIIPLPGGESYQKYGIEINHETTTYFECMIKAISEAPKEDA